MRHEVGKMFSSTKAPIKDEIWPANPMPRSSCTVTNHKSHCEKDSNVASDVYFKYLWHYHRFRSHDESIKRPWYSLHKIDLSMCWSQYHKQLLEKHNYAEIMHSDRLFKVTWLVLTNHTALCQYSYITLKFVYLGMASNPTNDFSSKTKRFAILWHILSGCLMWEHIQTEFLL